jgi:hypothetical protein
MLGSTFGPTPPHFRAVNVNTEHASAILHALNQILGSATASDDHRTKAALTLREDSAPLLSYSTDGRTGHLIADDPALVTLAVEYGCPAYLGAVVAAVTPLDVPRPLDWDVSEPASTSAVREAGLLALAALALADVAPRGALLELPGLVPALHAALAHTTHAGSRYATLQLIRALARAVALTRTGLVDTGLARAAIELLLRSGEPRPGTDAPAEDRRVVWAALAAVCNLVVDFSPVKSVRRFTRATPFAD